MKIFWSFIALIMLGTGVLFVLPTPSGDQVASAETPDAATAISENPSAIEGVKEPVSETIPNPREMPEASKVPTIDAATGAISANDQATPGDAEKQTTPVATDPAPIKTATETASQEKPAGPITEPVIVATNDVPTEEAEESKDDPKPTPVATNEVAPKTPEERFAIKGSGTKDDPYRVTWEMLTSAYESYRPREEKTDIPEHIQMLHDKYVRISGYLAFPMLTGQVDEALVMLNQWDGCCLGVPPSPYDSIEVTLSSPVEAEGNAFTPFGAVEGKLLVDPYLVNGWLVGLYLMESASVEMVG